MAWLPKTLRIGYETYRVNRLSPDANDEGNFCSDTRTINIHADGAAPRKVANTIIHETLHAIFYQSGMGNVTNQEEAIVNGIANGLSQVMRDNPEAMRRILKMATSK